MSNPEFFAELRKGFDSTSSQFIDLISFLLRIEAIIFVKRDSDSTP